MALTAPERPPRYSCCMAFPRLAPADDHVDFRPWQPSVWALLVSSAALTGIVLGILTSLFWSRGSVAGYEYHLWRWQADTLTSTVFARLGIGPNPNDTAGAEALQAYFALTSQIRAEVESANPETALLETLENERATYENDVERLVERYIGEVIADDPRLQRRLPLFRGVEFTWPPVEFELASPPRLLVRSPRDQIKRDGDTLLKTDLSLGDIEEIEARTDSDDTVSIVISIGGLAAYPAIIRDDRNYYSIVETAAHEWVHHYLAFFPLGEQWGKGGDAEALNETTANVAGREIANLVHRRHPIEFPDGTNGSAPARPPSDIDFNAEMRALRLDVDALLAEGRIEEAERLMEKKRQFFNENGIAIRKINQAYFAFYGTYADSAQSSNPIGDKIDRIWQLTGDVGLFLAVMREVTDTSDLDAVLADLEALDAGG